MKYILPILALLGVLLFSYTANATPVSREQALAYFHACMAQTDPRFSAETQETFCGCTASYYEQSMEIEDVRALEQQTNRARAVMNKIITDVYAPCIKYPTLDYHYQQCMGNPQVKIIGNPQKVCKCAANNVAFYLQENGQRLFKDILRQDPNIPDPMEAIYNSIEFQRHAQSTLMGCIR